MKPVEIPEDIALLAVKEHGYAIDYIKDPSEVVQLAAVKRNGDAIAYIIKILGHDPSEAVQLAAVKRNGYVIDYIKNPSEVVQLAVMKRNGYAIECILGIFIVSFALLTYFKVIKNIGLNVNWGYIFGLFSGLLGGAFNTNGPPIIVYFYLQGLNKEELKASITGYFIFTSSLIVLSHLVSGLATTETYISFLKFIPIVLIGIVTGNMVFKRINSGMFNFIILIILFVLGVSLLFR